MGRGASCCAKTTCSRSGSRPEYGGTGTGTLTFLRAVEELCWADATVGLVLAVQSLGAIAVELSGIGGAEAALPAAVGQRRVDRRPTR